MMKTLVRILAVAVLLALLALLVPSSVPVAMCEDVPAYQPVVLEAEMMEPISYAEKVPYAPIPEGFLEDGAGYLDSTISVRVETMRAYDTTIQLTWVQIRHPSQLRAKLASPYPSKTPARADVIARRVSSVVAMNDDWCMNRAFGYIVRNGEVLREKHAAKQYDALLIDEKGDMHIILEPNEEKISAFEGQIIHAFSFGPGLVIDGEMRTDFSASDDVMREIAHHKVAQRIAFCQMDELSYLIVATEGPENAGSVGLTITQFAEVCHSLGVKQAFNLDGGSSSSVVLGEKKINSLSTKKIRAIGGILYFVTADPTVPRED